MASQSTLPEFDLENLVLTQGAHARREEGMCVEEAVAAAAGEPHSDSPQCADPAIATICRVLNDRWDDEGRQKLRALIFAQIGTRGSIRLSSRRRLFIIDGLVRSLLPALLRELPNTPAPELAAGFEALDPIVDAASATSARDFSLSVRDDLDSDLDISLNLNLALDLALTLALDLAGTGHLARALALDLDLALTIALTLAPDLDLAPWKALRDKHQDRVVQLIKEACLITA
jgi:hypothetical protein